MLQFNNEYKLYNLLEALQLDNYDDIDSLNMPQSNNYSEIVNNDRFDDFVQERILKNSDRELTPMEQILINNVNKDDVDEFTGRVVVNDTDQLKTVLQRGVKYFGNNGNYNWINTSKIKKMLKLFSSALGEGVAEFNGDISKWDVSNVDNMLYIFKDCASLTCDISNWDTSNVVYWCVDSYEGTKPEFKAICKKLKFPKKCLRILGK